MTIKINEYGLPEPIVSEGGSITTTTEKAYSTEVVARILSIPIEELIHMREENCGPRYDVIKRKQKDLVFYPVSGLREWLRERNGKSSPGQNTPDKF